MKAADEMVAKTAPTGRQPPRAVAGADDMLRAFDERWSALKDLERTSNQRKPVEDLHRSEDKLNKQPEDSPPTRHQSKPVEDLDSLIPCIGRLDDEISDRVRAIESRTKRRASRGFTRFLVAICLGVAGTLAWQSYGEATKHIIAASAPELGWSPEVKQMIAAWVQQVGWTKSPPGFEKQVAPVAQIAVAPEAPAAPSLGPQQAQQMARDLATLRQTVEQLAAGQDQVTRQIGKLEAADLEILAKITAAPPPPRPIAAPVRKPMPVPPTSQPPVAPPTSLAPIPPQ